MVLLSHVSWELSTHQKVNRKDFEGEIEPASFFVWSKVDKMAISGFCPAEMKKALPFYTIEFLRKIFQV